MIDPVLLTTVAEIDSLLAESRDRIALLFKHSVTCPVSDAAFAEFHAFLESIDSEGETMLFAAVIEIQNARPVSAAVAERTGVRHESPQAIVFQDEEAIWHASHQAITAASLRDTVESVW
ncbi:MAG: bacillithiol system redox-active protein YtxJ [Gemmatimonadota bacterium]|jgi:bacillithiol system protein YtxJ|nr:bacillithiol system redox-active protein YtxJ [Gemmatimonadota bacterium]MDP6802019.1 bacillithiol system redox-active protein YtxJ [Gemmatimonadota bacterium]MDP7031367.1 bacillithiol system redox-active protein YtxJ [Gemmatimonadota bacterium]